MTAITPIPVENDAFVDIGCACGSTETIELVRDEQAITICAGCGRDD